MERYSHPAQIDLNKRKKSFGSQNPMSMFLFHCGTIYLGICLFVSLTFIFPCVRFLLRHDLVIVTPRCFRLIFYYLWQRSANYSPWAKSLLTPVFLHRAYRNTARLIGLYNKLMVKAAFALQRQSE